MKARILVRLRPSILDVQGKALEKAIAQLKLTPASGIRVGKVIEVLVPQERYSEREAYVDELCKAVLVNPITEEYSVEFFGEDNHSVNGVQ